MTAMTTAVHGFQAHYFSNELARELRCRLLRPNLPARLLAWAFAGTVASLRLDLRRLVDVLYADNIVWEVRSSMHIVHEVGSQEVLLAVGHVSLEKCPCRFQW